MWPERVLEAGEGAGPGRQPPWEAEWGQEWGPRLAPSGQGLGQVWGPPVSASSEVLVAAVWAAAPAPAVEWLVVWAVAVATEVSAADLEALGGQARRWWALGR